MDDRLFRRDGSIAVDQVRFPGLHGALERALEWRAAWAKAHRDVEAQHRLIRQQYGLADPMPAQVKEALRARAKDPEVKAARRARQRSRRRLRAITKPQRRTG